MTEQGNPLATEIATYEQHQDGLRRDHPEDHWVLVKATEVLGVFEDFDAAVAAAQERAVPEPYLVRQVRPSPVMLPSCVAVRDSLLA